MKRSPRTVLIVLIAVIVFIYIYQNRDKVEDNGGQKNTAPLGSSSNVKNKAEEDQNIVSETIVAKDLDTPWGLAFLPDKSMLVTQRPGRVSILENNGNLSSVSLNTAQSIKEIGEGGLLGITTHPDFSKNHYVYLYYTYGSSGGSTLNRVSRFIYNNKRLTDERIIVDKIPGASNHNGGRIKFGPDNFLYITTGDAQNSSQAQKTDTLAGKILRVTDEGKSASGNPFGNFVYSYGHRNPQGVAWDDKGNLWQTEHGRSLPSGYDEVNLIEKGKNYGWPDIEGDETKPGMVTPKKNSGANTTWAPAGAAFLNNSLYFGGLRGQALFQADTQNNQVVNFTEHFKGKYGRIRDVVLGPDRALYITTSNRDSRGTPSPDDDRIIRLNF